MNVEVARFSPNYGFTSSKRKVNVPVPTYPNTREVARAQEERGDYIDSVIVRLMKTNQRMEARSLVNETLERITMFPANTRAVKKRLVLLMDRRYMKRDPDDPNMFIYVADDSEDM